jgi:hypothetical protein
MRNSAVQRNPFALMMDPQSVIAAMEGSERLARLQRHICRPLDRTNTPGDGLGAHASPDDDIEGRSLDD